MSRTNQGLRERDAALPDDAQGLYRKFEVRRVDGSDGPGGKHAGCQYFVLDVTHDPHSAAALDAYQASVAATHPVLAADMRACFGAGAAGEVLSKLDAAFDAEIERVSSVPYDSHQICRAFFGKLRERLVADLAGQAPQ